MAPHASKLICSLASVAEQSDTLQPRSDLLEYRDFHSGGGETRLPLKTQPTARFFLAAGAMASSLLRCNFQIPCGTWALVMAMGGIYAKPDGVALSSSALLPSKVMQEGEVYRLIVSALVHKNATHFILNASSLIDSGSALEKQMGTVPYLLDVTAMTILSHAVYVGAAWMEKALLGNDATYSKLHAPGFSCVSFALGVLTGAMEATEPARNQSSLQPGLRVWCQLLLTSLFLPDSSLLGHISGICVGLLRLFLPGPFIWLRKQATKFLGFMVNRRLENRLDDERKLDRYRSRESACQHLCLFAMAGIIYIVRQKRRAL